jgi:uncharacterized protein YdhG (YjbR/CyaY superfamily)
MRNNDNKPVFKTMDEYIALQSEAHQLALEHIRQIVRDIVPEAEECISYQIPMFKYKGMLVGFAAFQNHCSFVAGNGSTIERFKDELQGFTFAKSVIHFTPEKPLSDEFVKRFVQFRVQENEAKKSKKSVQSQSIS